MSSSTKPTLVVNDAVATGTAGSVTYEFEVSRPRPSRSTARQVTPGPNIAERDDGLDASE